MADVSARPSQRTALFALGFRPFYLCAAILAAAAVPLWIGQYLLLIPAPGYLSGIAWHAHEMVFGFAAAVISGFLFTAARNWTGLPTPTGSRLAALALLWIAGRVLVFTGPGVLAAAVDVAFLPLVALALWVPLHRSRNRNQFFVGILLLFAAANLAFHLAQLRVLSGPPGVYAKAALYLVAFIVTLMAGRVVPAFTRNAIPGARVRIHATLDRAALASLAAALVAATIGIWPVVTGVLALAGAALHAVRLWRWDPWSTRGQPILWVLHLSYAWIPVGLLLLAGSTLANVPEVLALHALSVGAVGGMIIGMITRTALGHTARPLRAGAAETSAYMLVQLAALLRVFPGLLDIAWYVPGLVLSSVAWSAAFVVYLIAYVPILMRPRLDGKPG